MALIGYQMALYFYEVGGVIDEEDAIEVVSLMLEYLGQKSASSPFECRTVLPAGAHRRALMPPRLAVDITYGKAALIHLEATLGPPDDFRIYENAYLGGLAALALFAGGHRTVVPNDKDAVGNSYLGSSKRYTIEFRFECSFHFPQDARKLRRAEHTLRHRSSLGP